MGESAVVNDYGYGKGYSEGDGQGEGYGLIPAYGEGLGYGFGLAYGEGFGEGYGYGLAIGEGDGEGCGYGDGYGFRMGYGVGAGFRFGAGYGLDTRQSLLLSYFRAAPLPAQLIIAETNAELKRILIEAKGIDKLFAELNPAIVHQDIDGYGHPRRLLAIKVREARNGELRAVQVVCPTTGREYILGVPSTVNTCQQAVASTFGMAPHQYAPDRES